MSPFRSCHQFARRDGLIRGIPLDTLRAMFSVDGRMAISRESNGTVRMVETGVQTDILHVRISHLAFDKITEAGEALALVLNAPEVQSFMLAHGIRQLFISLCR